METITNIASTATSTVSNLIYGDQSKNNETANNETGGKEPISGEEGKGTATEPFDKGNAGQPSFFSTCCTTSTDRITATPLDTTADRKTFLDYANTETSSKEPVSGQEGKDTTTSGSDEFLKLNPKLGEPSHEEGAPKIHTNTADTTYTGMPIVPLNPDVATSGPDTTSAGTTEKTGVTDKLWKETALDDISRSGAPGAGPTAPSSETYQGSATPLKAPNATETNAIKESKERAEESLDGTVSPKTTTSTGGAVGESKSTWTQKAGHLLSRADGVAGLVGEKPTHKSEPTVGSPASDEKSSKMSGLKNKLKDKLHISSKDK